VKKKGLLTVRLYDVSLWSDVLLWLLLNVGKFKSYVTATVGLASGAKKVEVNRTSITLGIWVCTDTSLLCDISAPFVLFESLSAAVTRE